MFDTYVTIVGNVLTAPEWRRTTQSNTLVANFKVASTARRLDRDSGRWVDGNSLRVRVNCWRKLAEGVAASVMVGDPVVVCGRLYTRDWTDDAGNHRTLYELEAVAVGHDLSRGRARFLRNRPSMTTSTVDDAEAESRVHGESTEPVPAGEAPVLPDDRPLDDDFELSDFGASRTGPVGASLADGGPFDGGSFGADGPGQRADDPTGLDDDELDVPPGAPDGDPTDDTDDELGPVPDEGEPETAPAGRRRRGRVPQPA
ncbi:single-stranded DNA-binding protein [Micromonospora orduensis]|uniref:Single-stranded DNA-binding protein n=1 Tax=Micromonospora orduensis TaxID=1420891 RepID=A0A5C4QNN2_9ACTN|nr:single-stranded DNA-binding protein [Micromonospora orduensis]TNH27293.1 single-stranded DNA-binding protein [Micromonospora orduensis]